MNIFEARERYTKEADFKGMVDFMAHAVQSLRLTPMELREAATFALILVEQRTNSRVRIDRLGDAYIEKDYPWGRESTLIKKSDQEGEG